MNMSLYELYVWLYEADFPSISAIWTWLITVPWWLAIITVVFIIVGARISWAMTAYMFTTVGDWMYETGGLLRKWMLVLKGTKAKIIQFGRLVKAILYP